MYGPTILMESVMPSGLGAKPFSVGAVLVSAADALIARQVQTAVKKRNVLFIRKMKETGVMEP
jgi:hypothetical protein